MLAAEEYKFVLAEIWPQQPSNEATKEEAHAYQKWKKADEIVRCYILASMSNVLQHQHQDMSTAYDMVMSLKEIFGNQNRVARQVAMRELINTNMTEGTPARDHVLKMMSYPNELEILKAEIDRETQGDIVLQSLP